MIASRATRSDGTAAKACVRRVLPEGRWAPQWPQKLPSGTTDPQCGHVARGAFMRHHS